jgi:hypothetical protein
MYVLYLYLYSFDWGCPVVLSNRNINSVGTQKIIYYQSVNLAIDGSILDQVKQFNYLGCELSVDGEPDFDKKINRFQRICGSIRKHLKKSRTDTQMKFHKVVARPTLLYGSETWVTTERDITGLEAAEVRFLRSVTGYTRLDKIRSEVISKELDISGIQDVRSENKRNWINHLERMDNTRLPKHALNYKPRGRRDRGRPRKRWQRVDAGTGQAT